MASALNVAEEITAAWNELKGTTPTTNWMVIELQDSNATLAAKGGNDSDFSKFCEALPVDQPRYGVYNLQWEHADGRKLSKIMFINYVPDGCKVMAAKFAYAQSKDAMCANFSPINKSIQINDRLDLNETEWKEMF